MVGYVLLHRDLIGNPQFRGKDDEYAAIWLVARAAWEETVVRVNREAVTLQRGQCAYSISFLAEAWECSKTTAYARVRHLESCGFIRTQAERGYTIISVCKYNDYQTAERSDRTQADVPSERQPNDARTNNKEGNEYNSEANASGESSPPENLIELKTALFRFGLKILMDAGKSESEARAIIGKWRKEYGDGEVLSVLSEAQAKGITEPIGWVTKALQARKQPEPIRKFGI